LIVADIRPGFQAGSNNIPCTHRNVVVRLDSFLIFPKGIQIPEILARTHLKRQGPGFFKPEAVETLCLQLSGHTIQYSEYDKIFFHQNYLNDKNVNMLTLRILFDKVI